MRKLLIFLLLSFMTLSVSAAPRTKSQAQAIAQKLTGHVCTIVEPDGMPANSKKKSSASADEEEAYYVFNNGDDNGYIIISGEDRLPALVGYTDRGTFNVENMPIQLQEFLSAYTTLVENVGNGKITLSNSVTDNVLGNSGSITPVAALLGNIVWDQDDPFNQQCPLIGEEHTVTGCGPTAVAQVMCYWKYPAALPKEIPAYTVKNNVTYDAIALSNVASENAYDWDNMLPQYTSSATQNQKDAVAKLMNHVGHVMKATYGLSSSGGTSTSYDVLRDVFTFYGYDSSLLQRLDKSNFSYSEWKTMVTNEIEHRRPVIYGAQAGSSGHAFVLDGVDANGLYHVNWGWSGLCNGYYDVTILNPNDNTGIGASTSTDGYNGAAMMVVGITPTNSAGETAYATSGTAPTTSTTDLEFTITNKDGETTLMSNAGCDTYNKIKLTINNNGTNEFYSAFLVVTSSDASATPTEKSTPMYICVPANSSITIDASCIVGSLSKGSTYYYTLYSNAETPVKVAQQEFTISETANAPQLTVTSITSTASESNLTPTEFNKVDGSPTLMLPTLKANSITYTVTINNAGGYYCGEDIAVGYLDPKTKLFNGYFQYMELPAGNSTFKFTDSNLTIGELTGIQLWSTSNKLSLIDNVTQNLYSPSGVDCYSFNQRYFAYVAGPETNVNVTSANLASNDNAYYSSLYLGYAVQLPDGVSAYTAIIDKPNSKVTLNKIESGIVPANTGVVLRITTKGNYELTPCNTTETASSDLQGVLEDTPVSGISSTPYVLSIYNGSPAFQRYSGTTLRANKAYLILPSGAKSFSMGFEDEEASGISDVKANPVSVGCYNLQGQRVSPDTKGIIIINGKKVINK